MERNRISNEGFAPGDSHLEQPYILQIWSGRRARGNASVASDRQHKTTGARTSALRRESFRQQCNLQISGGVVLPRPRFGCQKAISHQRLRSTPSFSRVSTSVFSPVCVTKVSSDTIGHPTVLKSLLSGERVQWGPIAARSRTPTTTTTPGTAA